MLTAIWEIFLQIVAEIVIEFGSVLSESHYGNAAGHIQRSQGWALRCWADWPESLRA